MIDLEAEAYVDELKALVRAIRALRSEMKISPKERPVLYIEGPQLPERMYAEIRHLAKVSEIVHLQPTGGLPG